jgi:hypothetical protein
MATKVIAFAYIVKDFLDLATSPVIKEKVILSP